MPYMKLEGHSYPSRILYKEAHTMPVTAVESKIDAFKKVIRWLRAEGLPRIELERNGTKLYAKVFPLSDEPIFLCRL